MFIIPPDEPIDYCDVMPRRLCSSQWKQEKCRCDACKKWNKDYIQWSRGIKPEDRLKECMTWRKEIGLKDDETRCYGGINPITLQTILLADAPFCPTTSTRAGETNCGCKVCAAYCKYYYEVTSKTLLPLLLRGLADKGKRCNECLRYKPFEKFHRDRHQPGGFKSKCKTCRSKLYEHDRRPSTRK